MSKLKIFRNSPFVGLVAIFAAAMTVVLFSSALFFVDRELDEKTAVFAKIHDLEIATNRFSEEYFHTQLELWEYAYLPTPVRLDHLNSHRMEFKNRIKKILSHYEETKNYLDQETQLKIQKLVSDAQEIDQLWEGGADSFENKNSSLARETFLRIEKKFDEHNFSKGISDAIASISAHSESGRNSLSHKLIQNLITIEIVLLMFLVVLIVAYYRNSIAMQRVQDQLTHMDKLSALGQLSAGMAHEINNPLMFIQGFNSRVRAELKKNNIASSSLLDSLSEIDSGVGRIQKIVNHLRDFSRKSHPNKEPVCIDNVITKAFSLYQEQLKHKGIDVSLNLQAQDKMIAGDFNKLEQIFFNLIGNAKDALLDCKKEGKRIQIFTSSTKGFVEIKFADNANGISKKDIGKIFDPFYTTKPVGLGTGLGLSIIQGIVREHSGNITVSSQPGEGTTFTLSFPLTTDVSGQTQSTAA